MKQLQCLSYYFEAFRLIIFIENVKIEEKRYVGCYKGKIKRCRRQLLPFRH